MIKYYYLFKVSMERTVKELIRYKFNSISNIVIFYVLFMAMFMGVKSFGINFGISPIDMGDTLESFVVGYFLWTIMMMAYSNISYGIMNDANRGTLEQLNMSGIKLSTIVTARSITTLLTNSIVSIILLLIIILTTQYHFKIKILTVFLSIFIGIFSIMGIGLIFGGLALIFKKIESLLGVIQYFLIGFVMLDPENPIIYNLIPFRAAADKVFLSMMKGYTLIDFSIYEYGIMIGNSILYFGVGLIVFNKCVEIAKKKGILGQY